MSYLFASNYGFSSADVAEWDTSRVTDMSYMVSFLLVGIVSFGLLTFHRAIISCFLVAQFASTGQFNAPIGSWDVQNVRSMDSMFNQAKAFNAEIGTWDVSNVENFDYVFFHTPVFNQDLSAWDVTGSTSMSSMFRGASNFQQSLCAWAEEEIGNIKFESIFKETKCIDKDDPNLSEGPFCEPC